jgi:hypothetical protein
MGWKDIFRKCSAVVAHRWSRFGAWMEPNSGGCGQSLSQKQHSRPPDLALTVYPYQGYFLPSQVQNVASPSSTLELSLPPSSVPFHPFSAITFNIHSTLSFGLMIPSTSQSKLTFDAISVLTSPGSTMIGRSALCSSGLFQK